MDCCQYRGMESQFDRGEAERKLRAYRRRGPVLSTRILLDALVAEGVAGLTLLDIGGGVGAIQHELLKATRLYGLVYPRDTWWVRAGLKAENAMLWLQRTPFRVFAHCSAEVDAVVRRNGMERRFKRNAGPWQVVVYARQTQAEDR